MPWMDATFWRNALAFVGLAALVVAGGLAIRHARREMLGDRPERLKDALAPFDEALRLGELNEAEYQRIRGMLERRRGVGAVPPPTAPPPDVPTPEAKSDEPGSI